MRMGVLLFAPAAVPPVTPFTLSSRQSHSIPDNLVALLGHSRAWNCSSETHGLRWRIRRAGFGCQANTALRVHPSENDQADIARGALEVPSTTFETRAHGRRTGA